MTAINGNAAVQTTQTKEKSNTQRVTAEVNTEKAVTLSSDQVNVGIKKGIVPTLKGAGAGALATGVPVGLYLALTNEFEDTPGTFNLSVPFLIGAAISGAIGGAVAANTTSSKTKGALIGAASSAIVLGVALAVTSGGEGSLGCYAGGIAAGGITGAVGGFFGSMVSKNK